MLLRRASTFLISCEGGFPLSVWVFGQTPKQGKSARLAPNFLFGQTLKRVHGRIENFSIRACTNSRKTRTKSVKSVELLAAVVPLLDERVEEVTNTVW